MKNFITDKKFYKSVLAITIPIALQNLIGFGVSVTDTIMLGQLGELQLSASAQANQPTFVFSLLTFGLAGGGCVLASQYWGKKNMEAIRQVIGIVLRVAIIASFFLTTVVLLFPNQIMGLYLKDQEVIDEAVKYLRIVGCSYLFFGITSTFTSVIRSVEMVKIAVIVSGISFMVNVVINYILIFGHFGAPRLEIRGAAIGTLTARIVEFVIIAIYALKIDKKLQFRLKYILQKNKKMLSDYTKYSIPVVLNEVAWGVGISTQAAILGRLSTEILAANSIASVLQQFSTVIIFGVANATCVIVGKKIGQGDMPEARRASFTMMVWSVVLGIVAFFTIFLLRNQFVAIYNVTENTRILTENLLIITAAMTFFSSINCTAMVGVLRGAGDTKFTFKLELIALWVISIPIGAYAGFVLKFPILITYILLKADEPIKVIISFMRTLSSRAYKNVTREE